MTRRAREPCPAAATNRELHQLGDLCGSANAMTQVAIAAHYAMTIPSLLLSWPWPSLSSSPGMVGLDREAKGIRFGGAFARS